jgi:hypothetical protein
MAMSKEHKDALVQGRKESRAIKAYLDALSARRPGRPVTKAGIEDRLKEVRMKIASTEDPLRSVDLIQTRLELEDQLKRLGAGDKLDELESAFVESAASYSQRKGISYTAWREIGVPAATLRKAGISERRRRG